jgi:DNA mismatch endonuclease (patch repair protein)
MDRLSPEKRSANMRAVRRKDTAPELAVRRVLHRLGYRYRLHDRTLTGSPDIVFTRRRKALFVHGCFWHGHDCPAGRPSKSRTDYWGPKIKRNRERDAQALSALTRSGWQCLVVWGCEVADPVELASRLQAFVGPPRTKMLEGKLDR